MVIVLRSSDTLRHKSSNASANPPHQETETKTRDSGENHATTMDAVLSPKSG